MKNFIILFLVMLSGIATGWFCRCECDVGGVVANSDTIIKVDTFFYEKPSPASEKTVAYVTRWLPMVTPAASATGTGPCASEPGTEPAASAPGTEPGGEARGTVAELGYGTGAGGLPDSCEVVLPITTKEYNSTYYRAWVSGYEASLDSIEVYRNTEIITMDKKRRRWGCVFGIGYGAALGGVTPYVGVMLGYRLF